jgi:general secretion pathway protein A
MLSNLEDEKNHLIQMILVGQPELKNKLKRRDLVQFAQRVTVHCHLYGLNASEVKEYILYRLKVAGSNRTDIFTDEAIELISHYSKGIPRIINILCDTALVYGYADNLEIIQREILENVIQERDSTGVFSGISQENFDGTDTTDPNDLNADLLWKDQFDTVVNRLEGFESRMVEIEKQIEKIMNYRDERDLIVVDLFKMLKENMENRLKTLLEFVRLQKKEILRIKQANGENPEQPKRFSMTRK